MKKIAKLVLAGVAAWIGGLGVILTLLYFGNGGSDFTLTDFMGFGVLFVLASTLLMLGVYLPGLFWFRGRSQNRILFPLFSGLLLNLPIFVLLAILIGRKVSASEAFGFMLTFLVAGLVFGFGFAAAGYHQRQRF
jgi:hypothetical protein